MKQRSFPMLLTVSVMTCTVLGIPAAAPGQQGRLPEHITPEAAQAIDAGLSYLAKIQSRDGSWHNRGQYGAYPVAMTGLAGLALLMDGNTTTQGRYAPQVDRAARYLINAGTANGLIARLDQDEGRPMYGHGFAMLFLAELYGMTEDADRQREIHSLLARAVDLTARSQSRLGGWIYQPDSGGDEGSVTITQVQALRACRNAGIAVPKQVIDQAMNYLKISANSDGGIAYRAGTRGPSRPAITAAAVCCWFNAGEYDNPLALRALKFAKDNIRIGRNAFGHAYYSQLYFSQAMFISGKKDWDPYFPPTRDFLLRQQRSDGSWQGDHVGRVYGTAVALIVLQLPYNRLPIMQR
ncbi:MAG: prenyltransferase/squalene oxidase repeat-containing protein [Phycisphaerae bacterium]